MTELQKLLVICRSATNGPWELEFNDEDQMSLRSVGPLSAWEYCFDKYPNLENDSTFVCTFNPQRVEKLLLAIKKAHQYLYYLKTQGVDSDFLHDIEKIYHVVDAAIKGAKYDLSK